MLWIGVLWAKCSPQSPSGFSGNILPRVHQSTTSGLVEKFTNKPLLKYYVHINNNNHTLQSSTHKWISSLLTSEKALLLPVSCFLASVSFLDKRRRFSGRPLLGPLGMSFDLLLTCATCGCWVFWGCVNAFIVDSITGPL